ncbi:hypothetical protein [Lactococcus lactis]|uniref:hypothetical protein n=1 Tax=Lactococcus lactis TaxID=1358 RepID=UPI0018C58D39|nr:hypothetical protein [Lactococcus lactis]MBG1279288.1 hypothetical protein [Lactococcus lactis subsp. lactis]
MDIYSKGFALQPRHLRRFNGKMIAFFDGSKGKIEYPYVMIKRQEGYCPSLLENARVFQEIRTVENGRTVIAERLNHQSRLLTTGKGITAYTYKRK